MDLAQNTQAMDTPPGALTLGSFFGASGTATLTLLFIHPAEPSAKRETPLMR